MAIRYAWTQNETTMRRMSTMDTLKAVHQNLLSGSAPGELRVGAFVLPLDPTDNALEKNRLANLA
jgi:hypothetical protein